MLIYAQVNSAFSSIATPRISESRDYLQAMPSVSGEKGLKPKISLCSSISFLSKRIFLPENLENSRGGVSLHSKTIEWLKINIKAI